MFALLCLSFTAAIVTLIWTLVAHKYQDRVFRIGPVMFSILMDWPFVVRR